MRENGLKFQSSPLRVHPVSSWVTVIVFALVWLNSPHPACGQGQVVFANRISGTLITHVYVGSWFSLTGNGPNDFPPGTSDWTGFALATGPTYRAQLLAAPGENAPQSALVPATPSTTFRTGSAAGFVAITTATLHGVPQDAPVATIQMVAWADPQGLYPTWAEAYPAWLMGRIGAGTSNPFNVYAIGGVLNTPPFLVGLQSFNIMGGYVPPIAPYITSQPTSLTVTDGQDATFDVGASGTAPLSYQWLRNGQPIPGATQSSLVLKQVTRADSGSYSAQVSNSAGSVVSAAALLEVRNLGVYGDGQLLTGSNHTFLGSVELELVCGLEQAFVFFTLDGSPPDHTGHHYLGPFSVSRSVTLRVVAYRWDFAQMEEVGPVQIEVIPAYDLIAFTKGGGDITLNPPTGPYPSNSTVTVTASPHAGWSFMGWFGDASEGPASIALRLNRPMCLEAVFGTPLTVVAAGNGLVEGAPSTDLIPFGTALRLTAVPIPGNYLSTWGVPVFTSSNPISLLVTNSEPVVSCLFASLPTGRVAFTALAEGLGSVFVDPATNAYPVGSGVTLTAVPGSGQTFLGWSGSLSGVQNPVWVSLNDSRTIVARFSARPQIVTGGCLFRPLPEAVRLGIDGQLGAVFEVQGSTNYHGWTTLGLSTNLLGTAQFIDTDGLASPQRFYRTVTLEALQP